ncbi:hypothetical protein KP509_26G048500 [Ceratopteris richardii]|uniref:Uncharacterized protein n=1 Tax=Ceratopteris richardii TaxID=49495 RepID=A0A8T2RLS8_CERRI|nr:hypothetical protein KP509_26G048500 [Ceratopteris richardii]
MDISIFVSACEGRLRRRSGSCSKRIRPTQAEKKGASITLWVVSRYFLLSGDRPTGFIIFHLLPNTYYTGCGYLAGALIGGGLGISDGQRAAEKDDTLKLRVNWVLNASGHKGRSYGNKLGIVGLLYADIESTIVHIGTQMIY